MVVGAANLRERTSKSPFRSRLIIKRNTPYFLPQTVAQFRLVTFVLDNAPDYQPRGRIRATADDTTALCGASHLHLKLTSNRFEKCLIGRGARLQSTFTAHEEYTQ